MDYGGDIDTMKADKITEMKKFKRNRKAKKFFRYAFVAASAVLLSWSSVWIPVVVKTAGIYFHNAFSVVVSTKFVFFMCNVIIVTLAVKSGQLGRGGGSNGGSPDLYEEFVKNTENRPKYYVTLDSVSDEPEEKQCVLETTLEVHEKSILPEFDPVETEAETEAVVAVVEKVTSSKPVKIARSKSENIAVTEREAAKGKKKLQRSETSIQNPQSDGIDHSDESSNPDELKNMCEAFIAKQWKLQRQESLADVEGGD